MSILAASRRAGSKLGDLAFNLLAAGLGLALLFATGRHLFALPVAVPQQTVALESAAPVAHAAVQVGSMRVAGPVSVTAPAGRAVRARTIRPPRAATPRTPSPAIVKPRTATHPAALSDARLRATAPSRAVAAAATVHPQAALVVAHRHAAAPSPVASVAAHPQHFAVTATAANVSKRPREKPRAIARPVVAFHRSPFVVSDGRLGAREIGPSGRVRIGRRPVPAHAASIIEPPLGYDGQPTLVVAPGAARLELGEVAIPTIRSRQRH